MQASGQTTADNLRDLIMGFQFDKSDLPDDKTRLSPAEVFQNYMKRLQEKHLEALPQRFAQKFEAQKQFFEKIDLAAISKATVFASVWAATTNPAKMTVDLTEDASVILTLAYPDGRDAYLEFFFEPGAAEPVQHNLTIYKDSNPVFSYGGNFTQTLGQFFVHFAPFAGLRP